MEEPEEPQTSDSNQLVLRVLELLKQASHDLQSNPPRHKRSDSSSSSAIKALLELETESDTILSCDPNLSQLSNHLSYLKNLVETLQKTSDHFGLRSFLRRRASTHEIARVAGSIETELQAWIDREFLENLVKSLHGFNPSESEEELIKLLTQFEDRVSQGFNHELQDLVLKSKVFSELEAILCNPNYSNKLREHSAFAIEALIRFNKNVFVGQVLMGPTIQALTSMSSVSSLQILCSLIKLIKSPLVDEIESNDEIPKIIGLLSSKQLDIQILAMDCVLDIGYYGRKEAIEAVIREGLVEKLVDLQRSELGGDLIAVEDENSGGEEGNNKGKKCKREKYLKSHPFASCVARFAVQLEVGEGLRQREKRAFKQEILKRVREASLSDAEAATVVAEVLWGASP